ncbi:MAG: hypothetical protein LBV16_02655, partial [Elusimicrobiota bacterium]|nr:hypothetical protein [Elusimicrobiota bacterium]
MSLIDFKSVIRYEADGQSTEFSIPFAFKKRDDTSVKTYDISVFYRPPAIPKQRREFKLTENQHYTIAQNEEGKGHITILQIPEVIILDENGDEKTLPSCAVAPSESVIGIIRDTLFEQVISYIENSPNPAKTTEDALDKTTYETQQLREAVSRAIKIPVTWADNPDDILIEILEAVDLTKAKAQEAKESAQAAKASENAAANSAADAANSANQAQQSANDAAQSAANAAASAAAAAVSETNASQSETNADAAKNAAEAAQSAAETAAANAATSENNAQNSENNAAVSESNAADSARSRRITSPCG